MLRWLKSEHISVILQLLCKLSADIHNSIDEHPPARYLITSGPCHHWWAASWDPTPFTCPTVDHVPAHMHKLFELAVTGIKALHWVASCYIGGILPRLLLVWGGMDGRKQERGLRCPSCGAQRIHECIKAAYDFTSCKRTLRIQVLHLKWRWVGIYLLARTCGDTSSCQPTTAFSECMIVITVINLYKNVCSIVEPLHVTDGLAGWVKSLAKPTSKILNARPWLRHCFALLNIIS